MRDDDDLDAGLGNQLFGQDGAHGGDVGRVGGEEGGGTGAGQGERACAEVVRGEQGAGLGVVAGGEEVAGDEEEEGLVSHWGCEVWMGGGGGGNMRGFWGLFMGGEMGGGS